MTEMSDLQVLSVGEARSFPVIAQEPWNPSDIGLESGGRYRFSVADVRDWRDQDIKTDPDGFSRWWLAPFAPWRRVREENWFKLIGSEGCDPDDHFAIGHGTEFCTQAAGRLYAFANDIPGFYRNNHGRLTLTVERLA